MGFVSDISIPEFVQEFHLYDIKLLVLAGGALTILYQVLLCIYRLYFDPLSKFPGPKLAAVSHIWYGLANFRGRWPFEMEKLHAKYGPVVRIAPDELSFASASSYKTIYGHSVAGKKFTKGKFYDIPKSEVHNVFDEQDPAKHSQQRKSLSHGFSAKALAEQEGIIQEYIDLFLDQIEGLGTGPKGINMQEWFNFLTFDIIGDLAFGEPFGAITEAKNHFWVNIIVDGQYAGSIMNFCSRLPIFRYIAPYFVSKEGMEMRRKHVMYSREQIQKRKAKKTDREDFFKRPLELNAFSDEELVSNAAILIVGGSDTTSFFLASVMWLLAKNPETFNKLKKEVRGYFTSYDDIKNISCLSLKYLTGVIEESLRIMPPSPIGQPRHSPGAAVDGHYIPSGVVVSTDAWVTQHDPKYWARPWEFLPERWLGEDPEFQNDNKDAFKPFSTGPRACLGINLAYIEMRIVLAKLVYRFDWELLDKELDWAEGIRWTRLWKKPDLWIRYTPVQR